MYLKIALRHLIKDKMYTAINVLGLSVSLAVSALVFQYARFELSYDSFFENAPNIYRVTADSYEADQLVYRSALTSLQIAPALKSTFPELREVVQLRSTGNWFVCTLRYVNGEQSKGFNESSVFYTDNSFFNVFSWPLIEGDVATALHQPFSVVITRSTAVRYFGDSPALGKVLHLAGSIEVGDYTVTGVMPDLPEDSHLKINALFSTSSLEHNRFAENFETFTYFLTTSGTVTETISEKLPKLAAGLPGSPTGLKLSIQPIEEIHFDQRLQDEMKPPGNARSVYFLVMIAGFILIVALINFVNLTTSRALERAKEVGVRKVSGAHRSQLVRQFLTESSLIYFAGLLASAVMVITIVPYVVDVLGLPMTFRPVEISAVSPSGWLAFAAFAFVLFLAALYPARMISSYNPALVLKGRFTGSHKGLALRRGLVVFQFICSIGLITIVYVMHGQQAFMQKQDLGVDIAQTIVVKAPANLLDESCYDNIPRFKKRMQELSFVNSVTTSSAIPGQKIDWTANLRRGPGEPVRGRNFDVQLADPDFFHSYNLKLVAGKTFSESDFPKTRRFGSKVESLMFNEEAIRQLGFTSPEAAVDQFIYWDDMKSLIVGVVADYHQQSLKNKIQPMLFTANLGPSTAIKLNSKVTGENLASSLLLIQATWREFFPDSPFEYFFLEDFYRKQYSEDVLIMRMFDVFCGLAILISSLGLFGLSLFTTRQRTKEIGIRKVLGATLFNLLALLIGEFLRPVVIACAIALPLSFYLLDKWLSGFAFHLSLSGWQFILPMLLVIAIALVTVMIQTTKAAIANPTDSLKHE